MLGTSVPGAAAGRAPKIVEVFLYNRTGCDLTSRKITMTSGTVTKQSDEASVPPGGASAWRTKQSKYGNIAGTASFQTANCADAADSGRLVKVAWKNPLAGTNSYNSNGTDGRFTVGRSGGSGQSATVYFTVRRAS